MKILIRNTISGSEYWDTEVKRTLFVPKGSKPTFEVADKPESMIGGDDLTTGKDVDTVDGINLDDLNTEQLLSFAERNDIDVPGNMKKEDTIRQHIEDQLTAEEQ